MGKKKRKQRKQESQQRKQESQQRKINSIKDVRTYTMLTGDVIKHRDIDSINEVRYFLNKSLKEFSKKEKSEEVNDIYYTLRTFKNKFKNFCEVLCLKK